MKKSLIFLGCLALLMAGCNKVEMVETPVDEPAMEAPRHLTVNISVNHADDTRSVKTGWEVGDVIYVAFDHFFSEEQTTSNYSSNVVYYMTLTYDGTVWQSAFSNEALEQYLMEGGSKTGSLAAVYFSDFVPTFSFKRTSRGVGKEDYRFIRTRGGEQRLGFYLFDEQCSYSVADGVLTSSLTMHPYIHSRSERVLNSTTVQTSQQMMLYVSSDLEDHSQKTPSWERIRTSLTSRKCRRLMTTQ